MTSQKPTFRFAPSPTGYLHIGGARTAFYNYLLAKKTGGTFILRIEDTDLERSTPESIQAIIDGMKWLGLHWDEGPYFQTKRFDLYKEHVDRLIKEGKAYPCFCSAEDLSTRREKAKSEKLSMKYGRTCYGLSEEEIKRRKEAGQSCCIRFYAPEEGEVVIEDAVKGRVVIANKEMDDWVICRSDGSPTYNLTVVVDDAVMGVTHVIRGDDHLVNTPKQIGLYQAFGYPLPVFAHVPMILGTDKKRLSKRHGATSVMAYKEMGYLPEALLNYLARLGWAYKDEEVFSVCELIKMFSLENVSASAGIFNPEKLLWLNGLYIRKSDPSDLAKLTLPFLQQRGIQNPDQKILIEGIKISQEKVKTLLELADFVDFYFMEVPPPQELVEKLFNEKTQLVLKQLLEKLTQLETFTHDSIQEIFSGLVTASGLGLGKICQPVRVALTGRKVSAGVFEVIRVLGKQKTLERLTRYV